MKSREEFERSLNPNVIGWPQAKRNRTKYIKQLGKLYHEHAGKISLFDMFKHKEATP